MRDSSFWHEMLWFHYMPNALGGNTPWSCGFASKKWIKEWSSKNYTLCKSPKQSNPSYYWCPLVNDIVLIARVFGCEYCVGFVGIGIYCWQDNQSTINFHKSCKQNTNSTWHLKFNMDTLIINIMVVNAPKTMGANGVWDLTCCNKG